MNEKVLSLYNDILKKKSKTSIDELGIEVIDIRNCSKNGYRLLIKDSYGQKCFEYIDDNFSYKSSRPNKYILENYDGGLDLSSELLEEFGYGTVDSDDIKILADSLDNCEDWDYEDGDSLEDSVIENVSVQTNFCDAEINYLLKKYFKLNPIDRLNLDTVNWLNQEII